MCSSDLNTLAELFKNEFYIIETLTDFVGGELCAALKNVAIQCSNDAIIPHWAFMLVSSELKNINIKNFIGSVNDYENFLITEKINNINLAIYQDKPVIIKGCSEKKFKEFLYSVLIEKIQPVAKKIMFGEACSSVPIFKRNK